jgi:hypothetical protein
LIVDVMELLDAPGMAPLVGIAPLIGTAVWILVAALLWKDGFNDLFERFTRPRWTTAQRLATLAMIPWRAVMLTLAAALGAALTTLGLLVNIGVILNLVRAGKILLAG